MKERILFVGIGQCGGNIAYEFQKLDSDYNIMCINTSNVDLDTIPCRVKYHIPAAYGCNKDRMKALDYAKEYWQTMCNVIDRNFPRQDIIYFCYSLGGGTGSGIAPIIADIISERNKHLKKTYGIITVMPKTNEIIDSLKNTEISYKQTTNIQNVKPLYVLDNNNFNDKFKLNAIFASRFDKGLDMSHPDRRGVVDESELEDIYITKGNSVIEEWEVNMNGSIIFKPSVFTPYYNQSSKSAITSIDDININELRYKIGFTKPPHHGYSNDKNMFIASGMPYSDKRIKEIQYIINNYKEDKVIKGLDYGLSFQKDSYLNDSSSDKHNSDNQYKSGYAEKDIVKVDIKETVKPIDDDYFSKWM